MKIPRRIRVNVELEIEAPLAPNFLFIRLPGGGRGEIAAKDLSDEQIHEIGKLWTEDLLSRKKQQRYED